MKDERLEICSNRAGKTSIKPTTSDGMISPWVSEEYARRLVACWNICAGIDTELLEKGARHDWLDLMDMMEQSKEMMLSALNDIATGKPRVFFEGKEVPFKEWAQGRASHTIDRVLELDAAIDGK